MNHSYERLFTDVYVGRSGLRYLGTQSLSRNAGGLAIEQETCHEKSTVFSPGSENINYFGGLNLLLTVSH
jgi:hypothetical protein